MELDINLLQKYKDLGAKIFSIGVKPNGLNINYNCGSTFPDVLRKYVKKFKADLGIALDGDADRVIMCDEKAQIVDGDQIIAMIAKDGEKNFKRWSNWNSHV